MGYNVTFFREDIDENHSGKFDYRLIMGTFAKIIVIKAWLKMKKDLNCGTNLGVQPAMCISLLRICMIVFFPVVLFATLMSCSEDDPENDSSKNTSDIAVTGRVGDYGCTYAEISGYANIELLPMGSGNPTIGVELCHSDSVDDSSSMRRAESEVLVGNIFTVLFNELIPASRYQYRTFVTYDGETYYGQYSEFTTESVAGIATTGDATDITHNSVTITSTVRTESVDSLEEYFVGIAYAIHRSALHPDSVLECYSLPITDVVDGAFTVNLARLHDATTYYYAAFTEVDGVRTMSVIKEFTTETFIHKVAEAVDLGLSVKWASWNIGATAPEEYGCYYAWGEVEEKADYSLETYLYNIDSLYIDIGTEISGSEYDVAHVKWGDGWRMPTEAEIEELCDKCIWKLTPYYFNKGWGSADYTITGPNGNSIVIPAAGYYAGKEHNKVYSRGCYWTGTLSGHSEENAYILFFYSNSKYWDRWERYRGFTVRPVKDY